MRERARCLDEDCEWETEGPIWENITEIRDHMQETGHQVATRDLDGQSGRREGAA